MARGRLITKCCRASLQLDSELAPAVNARLNSLADDLYGEAILYQRVGDHGKALERIHRILTQAPYSPAADKLRQGATVAS